MSFNASASVTSFFGSENICHEKDVVMDSVKLHHEGTLLGQVDKATHATSSHCCSSMCVLYPPVVPPSLIAPPDHSLALIEKESSQKIRLFAQSLFKPPIY